MNILQLIITLFVLKISLTIMAQTHQKKNLNELHQNTDAVHTLMMFQATGGKVISLSIPQNTQLKEHTTPIPALLVCVEGEVVFEDEKGNSVTLKPGNYVNIEPNIKHWVNGVKNSQLLLIK